MRTRGNYRWYFVCSNCEAKAFATKAFLACPRCGASLESTEMQMPPWLKHSHDKGIRHRNHTLTSGSKTVVI